MPGYLIGHATGIVVAILLFSVPVSTHHLVETTAGGQTLRISLDPVLPRPLSILYSPGTNHEFSDFSPPNATTGEWWRHLSNQGLVPWQNYSQSYNVDVVKNPSVDAQVSNCTSECSANPWCVGWTLVKVTPTSGKKIPLCCMYSKTDLATTEPFYRQDPNMECGTFLPLTQTPPYIPSSCIGIVLPNASSIPICSNTSMADTSLSYVQVNDSLVLWNISLTDKPSSWTVMIAGEISLSVSSDSIDFHWKVIDVVVANHGHVTATSVRALDIGFALAGVTEQNSGFAYTQGTKTWCPPGKACQEWAHSFHSGSIRPGNSPSVPDLQSSDRKGVTWAPDDIPPAGKALLDPMRSNFVAAWNSKQTAGISFGSNRNTLPNQRHSKTSFFAVGPARVNINLRCGKLPAFEYRIGFFPDLTNDAVVDENDGFVWTRRLVKQAWWVYRVSSIWKLDSDITSYKPSASIARIPFNATLDVIAQMAHVSDNGPQVVYLVGWQGTGHDTLYPSLNIINPALGSSKELEQLVEQAWKQYNTIVSYHINTDEAYWNFSLPTMNGVHNPETYPALIDKTPPPNSTFWVWGSGTTRTDPLIGPSYHLSKTIDAANGTRSKRYSEFINTVPTRSTIHMDAWRDINVSWEVDERGFIAEDEEFECGCKHDRDFFESRGISFGVEGQNGMASNPLGVVQYYWHGHNDLSDWGRIIMGSTMGLDTDISTSNPIIFEQMADKIYLSTKVYLMQMTDPELLSISEGTKMGFLGGGNSTHWPYCGTRIKYKIASDMVFIPNVLPPPDGSLSGDTVLDVQKAYVYKHSGGLSQTTTLKLPACWVGKTVTAETITPQGRESGPVVKVNTDTLSLKVDSGRPIVLHVKD